MEQPDNTEKHIQKKSNKKIIGIVAGLIVIIVPVVIALIYMEEQPMQPVDVNYGVDDFPLEKFNEGYDILCLRGNQYGCLAKNDGRVTLSLANGIYKFQTVDYSLMKGFSNDLGHEENSISYAFYQNSVKVETIKLDDGRVMWLVNQKQ